MAEEVKELLVRVSATTELLRSNLIAAEREIAKFETTTNAVTQRVERNFKQVGQASGNVRQGMQQLSFQLNDVATQFASGTKPMQIFAQQSGQVIQAIQMMSGGTSGLAAFLGGPWGMALTVGVVALTPFISKLFEAGDAAEKAARKLYTFKDALADLRTRPMEALGNLQSNVLKAEGALRNAEAMPGYTGGGSEAYKRNTFRERQRQEAIRQAKLDLANARSEFEVAKLTAKTNESLFEIVAKAGKSRARSIKDEDEAGGAKSRRTGSKRKKKDEIANPITAEVAFRAEMSKFTDAQGEALAKLRDSDYEAQIELINKKADYDYEARREVLERIQQQEARKIDYLAGLYESAFRGGVNAIWDDFERIGLAVISRVLAQFTMAQFNGGGGGFDFGSALTTAFTSVMGFADGGRPPLGRVSVVGERGPELFVPDAAGTIIPNHALGGNGVALTINAPGATAETVAMIRREIANAAPLIAQAATGQTIRKLNRRTL